MRVHALRASPPARPHSIPPHSAPAAPPPPIHTLQVLRQKKLYEGQREQLYNQQYNVDSAAFTMQSMQDNVQVVQAMQAGAAQMAAMKKKHKELDVDEIWKTMDKLEDMRADFEEVQDAMGSYNLPDGVDEADLDAELDALGDEVLLEGPAAGELPAYLQGAPEALPEAPTGAAAAPAAVQAEDEFGLPAVASGPR